jgi:FkbM family methyltransferase
MTDWKFIASHEPRKRLDRLLDRLLGKERLHYARTRDGYRFYYHLQSLVYKDPSKWKEEWFSLPEWKHLKGGTFVDIGAGMGAYSIRLAERFNRVLAFEPNPRERYLLEMNIRLNRTGNVEVVPLAVSDSEGLASFRISSNVSTGGTLAEKHYDWVQFGSQITVQKTSLDRYLGVEMGKVDLVKIDVENHELKVLEGMTRLIEDYHPKLLVEIHQRSVDPRCQCPPCSFLQRHCREWRFHAELGTAHWIVAR